MQKPTNYLSVFDHFVGLARKGLQQKFQGLFIFTRKLAFSNPSWNNKIQ